MKSLFQSIMVLLLVTLAGCRDNDASAPILNVSAEVIETGSNYVKLSVDVAHAEAAAYICLPSVDRAPTSGARS